MSSRSTSPDLISSAGDSGPGQLCNVKQNIPSGVDLEFHFKSAPCSKLKH